ncbi:MAG TPA: formate dehydrogenase accessory protein FdhE [Vicinamibacteria bacterium]|nr:formate dehydrogenase accessory protein FdhE [Vicinamibacteria bacterium]
MTSPATPREPAEAAFARRAARADELAGSSRAALGPLRFAAGLYRAQATLAAAVASAHRQRPLVGRLQSDLDGFAGALRALLRYAAGAGPPALAEEARSRETEDMGVARARLEACWSGDCATGEDYLSRALLRPYLEVLAGLGIAPDRSQRPGGCPFCAAPPWIAARRSSPDVDGARRFLGCSLCGGEWPVNRVRCPACEEENPARLPSFQTDAHPFVRIEGCETCHRYLKSIDLTVDARSIPEVDDLVSLALDLWAAEQGFQRIEPGLAGV